LLVVDGDEQRGVGADRRGALQRERAVGSAALSDPLVGQIHRLHSVHGGWPVLLDRGERRTGIGVLLDTFLRYNVRSP
jgi:hypothetical protein